MQFKDNKAILLQIFSEHELYDMQLKYYSAVCAQPPRYYTMNNIILDKLGGLPVVKEREYDDYQK